MTALKRAETEYTEWRGDGTLPGISAKLEDMGREVGFWASRPDGYLSDGLVHVYAKGRNGHATFAVAMRADDARRLAASLLAMADLVHAGPVNVGVQSPDA